MRNVEDAVMLGYFTRQAREIASGGTPVILRKMRQSLRYLLAMPAVLLIRLLAPVCLLRIGHLIGSRIGHFAANTELQLCERDAGINCPSQRHLDLFYIQGPICNQQLAKMWCRAMPIWPAWLLANVAATNRLLPGWQAHEVPPPTQSERDVHNLLDRFQSHLRFTPSEEVEGERQLRTMGIPKGASFVCLIVRDSAYLDAHQAQDWSYHNYRDSKIGNYRMAVEALVELGYFVLRMGAKVHERLPVEHPRVIDYACNGMRSDFMDIYLATHCAFCLTTGTGWDSVAEMQRRPMVYVNLVPFGRLHAFRQDHLTITKRHLDIADGRQLSMSEIISRNVGCSMTSADYASQGVGLEENSAVEIRDIALEMHGRLAGSWSESPEDAIMQRKFWERFPIDAKDIYVKQALHGEIRGRFGAQFLRDNPDFVR